MILELGVKLFSRSLDLPIILLVLYGLVITAACIRIILFTDTPSKGLAYIFLVVSVPVVGILLYLSFGLNYRKNKLYKKKIQLDNVTFPEIGERAKEYNKRILDSNKEKLGHYFSLANFLKNKNLISDNNTAELLFNGEMKFPEVIKCLKEAEDHIHIEYYIYENDGIGQEIANILSEKAKSGVKVRFIYDDFGSGAVRKKLVKKMIEAGVEAHPFYQLGIIRFANRINYRNHRKIIVIDGVVGFVGGINVSDKYVNPTKSKLYWRDTHLKIKGTSVLNLQLTFLTDWNFCSQQEVKFSQNYFPIDTVKDNFGSHLVQIMASGPDSDYPSIMYSLMQIIMLAKKELRITTPYFIPDRSFSDSIKIAALSGVKVLLLVPGISDSFIVNTTSQSYYEELLEAGVEIYLYNKGFVHAKTLVCDDFISVVGTTNLDNRSFDLNFEVNAIVYDAKLAKQLSKQFSVDIESSEKLSIKRWKKRPFHKRLLEKTLHLFSSLM